MGDWFGGQQAPNADPSAGLSTQAAAAGQPSGLAATLGNPLLQGLLGMYAGAVGSPRLEGLGGAIKGGITGGLGLFNQAQLQQQELPLRQAQLKEAQLQAQKLGIELKPPSADELKAMADYKNQILAQAKAHPDPTDPYYVDPSEIGFANMIDSQLRGGAITGPDVMKTFISFKEANIMNALSKRYGMAASTAAGQAAIGGGGQAAPPPAQAQGAQPPAAPSGPSWPAPGGTADVTLNGQAVKLKTDADNKRSYSTDGGKTWVPFQ